MLDKRVEPRVEVLAAPVDHRTLRDVGEVALESWDLPVKHQSDADHPVEVVEPTEALAGPLALHLRPGRALQEAHRRTSRDEREVLVTRYGPKPQGHSCVFSAG